MTRRRIELPALGVASRCSRVVRSSAFHVEPTARPDAQQCVPARTSAARLPFFSPVFPGTLHHHDDPSLHTTPWQRSPRPDSAPRDGSALAARPPAVPRAPVTAGWRVSIALCGGTSRGQLASASGRIRRVTAPRTIGGRDNRSAQSRRRGALCRVPPTAPGPGERDVTDVTRPACATRQAGRVAFRPFAPPPNTVTLPNLPAPRVAPRAD